jgi:hypothetical protein
MPEPEILVPGAIAELVADDAPMDPKDSRIAELEAAVAQLDGALDLAREQLRAMATVPSATVQANNGPRLIGENWAGKTAAEAKAAGVSQTVLCSDGYFVPG